MSSETGVKRRLEQGTVVDASQKLQRTEEAAGHGPGGTYIEVDGKSCYHRVAYPKNHQSPSTAIPAPRYTGAPARDFPFDLDPFQRTAIACLEQGDSVLVSAHTSAGKTAVAQYACAIALRDKTRMIYTSPLKALSNQKYRELYDDFHDVGLLTGDITIREDASCLVVTTEVFRSMLYQKSSLIQEVKAVVFDEVHYLRDPERGVVWEECLILMPAEIQAVFLSATVPNAYQFATWFATVHGAACHVVYTENRPVPLQHYLFPAGADAMYLTIDEKGRFHEETFQQACAEIKGDSVTSQLRKSNNQSLDESSDIFKLMKMVLQRGYDPVIVFAFSKRTCELLALQLTIMDVNDEEEKQIVEQVLKNAMDNLAEQDRRLPQIQHILPMLKRGIGMHHSGLLPIVKEVVELLFQEGLIKVLFATETFSTGLNMPAKTVVFAGARKFDEGKFRWLYSGEYIQMSGRAGRRGIDDQGVVIMIADKGMDATTTREILKGSPLALLSAFRIGYRMILDNLKMEGGDPEMVIRRSYKQYLCEAAAPEMRAQLEKCRKEIDAFDLDERVSRYVQDWQAKEKLWLGIQEKVVEPKICLPFLNPGRLICIAPPPNAAASSTQSFVEKTEMSWGLLVNFKKAERKAGDEDPRFVADVLVNAKKEEEGYSWLPVGDESGAPQVLNFDLGQIWYFSAVRVHLPKNLKPVSGRVAAFQCLREVLRRLMMEQGTVPLMDPVKDMKVSNGKVKKAYKNWRALEERLQGNAVRQMPDFKADLEKHFLREEVLAERRSLEEELEAAEDMILKQELRHRLRLLVRLQYIDETGLVLKKGRVALCFHTADELALTEMIFNGSLASLTAHQLTALLSCVVQTEASQTKTEVGTEMAEIFQVLEKTVSEIGKAAVECKVVKQAVDYSQSFRPYLMEALYAWSKGASFGEIIKIADIYEGSAVRTIRQVHRVLMELEDAVKLTGQQELLEKIQSAQELIKRDVIFAASLYL